MDLTSVLTLAEVTISAQNLAIIALIGLAAGLLGGMLGIGGSIVMIPTMSYVFGYDQHLYQAAAMVANVAVSLPAARRHHQAGAVKWDVVRFMIPAAVLFAFFGVYVSNLPVFSGQNGGLWLGRVLAMFQVYVIGMNLMKMFSKQKDFTLEDAKTSKPASGVLGGVMGFTAGLLGIGGGAIAVPMQQVMLKLPLRNCIANSSTVIVVSAALGSIYKIGTLGEHDTTWTTGLYVGALLVPGAFIGGRIGAVLTHKLPLPVVRIAFILLMLVAAWKMAAFGE
ncbi:MAG: hypothetical protein CMJ19_07635 [Phycisphaeraceae bacterium]|nr:hypothetical protein [Phycisphaeraceae bacterium]